MSVDVEFLNLDESHLYIRTTNFACDQEICDFFSFFMDGYKFSPKFRAGVWDGKIRLFDLRTKKLAKGLLKIAIKFCRERDYTFSIDPSLNPKTGFDEKQILEWIDSIQITSKGKSIQLRDYQIEGLLQSFRYFRNLLISPTASGKSAILYYKIRYHIDQLDHNVMLIVPTTQLVLQMEGDFKDYSSANGWDVDVNTQLLYSGKEKVFNKKLMISTWQSLAAMAKLQPEIFKAITDRTDVLCCDEAHQFSSNTTLITAQKFQNAQWRTGTTGTLDDCKVNKLQLIGLFSEPYQVITTKELMDQNSVVKLDIKVCKLDYPIELKEMISKCDYRQEVDFLVGYEPRNRFIADLTSRCKGVTLVLYTYIEKHGEILYKLIKEYAPEREVRFIHGGVDVENREEVRTLAENDPECIIIASSQIFSTGTNIPSIENLIFAMPTKSTVRVRQQIGRGLRLRKGKDKCTLFDIADDLSTKGGKPNTTLVHMYERIDIYDREQFDYRVLKVNVSSFAPKNDIVSF